MVKFRLQVTLLVEDSSGKRAGDWDSKTERLWMHVTMKGTKAKMRSVRKEEVRVKLLRLQSGR